MLLTVSTTHRPATDLGFLLHKHPARVHAVETRVGRAQVFFPEVGEERCTAALLLEVDPVGLVRGRRGPEGEGGLFGHYVNDRPYAASSFLSVAIAEAFGTAMGGRSRERQELADAAIPLEARVPAISCRGGEAFLRGLFEPLGYEVEARRLPLDERFPEWGESPYFELALRRTGLLAELLSHLYVLIPVLDDEKHYWIGRDEVEKLLRRGEGWLAGHPLRDEIARRYLRRDRSLTREALARLAEAEGDPEPDEREQEATEAETRVEETDTQLPVRVRLPSLHEVRLSAVLAALKEAGARRVLDLGCGEGRLLGMLLKDAQFEEVVGMDVSLAALERAERRLKLDRLPPRVAERLRLLHGSLVYRDRRLEGFDAAAVVEVVEHLDAPRLAAFERAVFEFARPGTVVLTTPNREYNALYGLAEDQLRHRDHRFEWTRGEFEAWAHGVSERHGYAARLLPLGPEDPERGAPSQMGVFTRGE